MEGFLPVSRGIAVPAAVGIFFPADSGMGIEGNGQLKETAAKAQREMDKARRILDRQAKIIPGILITCAMTPLRPEQDIALNQYCQIINGTE